MEQPVCKRSHNAGFSLIEVVFATAIMAVSVLGLTVLTIRSIKGNQASQTANDVIRIASETAETLLAAPFEEVEDCSLSSTSNAAGGVAAPTCLPEDVDMFPDPIQDAEETASTGSNAYTISWDETPVSSEVSRIQINVEYAVVGGVCSASDKSGCKTHSTTIYKHKTL